MEFLLRWAVRSAGSAGTKLASRFIICQSGSYLDLHSVAHVDSDGVAAVHSGVKGRAGLWWSLNVPFRTSQVQLAGHCGDKKHRSKHAGISRVELNRFISYSVQETWANACAHHVMSGSKNKTSWQEYLPVNTHFLSVFPSKQPGTAVGQPRTIFPLALRSFCSATFCSPSLTR